MRTSPDRSPGGHRLCERGPSRCCPACQGAQRLGFSLDEVSDLLAAGRQHHGRAPSHGLRSRVQSKLAEVAARIEDLQVVRSRLTENTRSRLRRHAGLCRNRLLPSSLHRPVGRTRRSTHGVLSADEILQVRGSGGLLRQADGTPVRALRNAGGQFDVVVDGERGLITSIKNLSLKSLDRLANHYRWE